MEKWTVSVKIFSWSRNVEIISAPPSSSSSSVGCHAADGTYLDRLSELNSSLLVRLHLWSMIAFPYPHQLSARIRIQAESSLNSHTVSQCKVGKSQRFKNCDNMKTFIPPCIYTVYLMINDKIVLLCVILLQCYYMYLLGILCGVFFVLTSLQMSITDF